MNASVRSKLFYLSVLLVPAFLPGCAPVSSRDGQETVVSEESYYSMEDFESVRKLNTHVHINMWDTVFLFEAKRANFGLITVNVNPTYYTPIEEQQRVALQLVNEYPDDIAYATTFSLAGFNDPGWQEKTLAYLKDSFAKGAIAVKVWKNIGMELLDSDGKFVFIDDPKFDPILDFIEQNNATLIAHIAEPLNAWLPVEEMTVQGDKDYFSKHPQFHMYLHPEYPTHEQIIQARDHMLQKHPNLRVVGAHLGSLEWDVDELAARLDKYPNFAVDMAERISHLQHQAVADWQKVHDFVMKYRDRLIYATDEAVREYRPADEIRKQARARWLPHWQFFVSDDTMSARKVTGKFRGLKLPREVVDKIYRTNAEKWFPGLTIGEARRDDLRE